MPKTWGAVNTIFPLDALSRCWHGPGMTHKEQMRRIVDALGAEAIAQRVGGARRTVFVHCENGRFPASWFMALKDMCEEAGIPCPPALFYFKGMDAA